MPKMKDTIVMFPSPEISHLISMVELGKLILHHHPQYSVTILLTTGLVDPTTMTPYINRISQANPSIVFHQLPFLPTPPDKSPLRSHLAILFESLRMYTPNVRNALQSISLSSTIQSFIIGIFCFSSFDVGSHFQIPTYFFYSSAVVSLAPILYFPILHSQTSQNFKDLTTTYLDIPGVPRIRGSHMGEAVVNRADPAYYEFLDLATHLPKSKGIISNTFESLEPIPIKATADGACIPHAPTPPVYCIGPLIADGEVTMKSGHECLSWLNAQPSRSVVFLCFGSRGVFSALQLKEIAHGLEKSGQRFLWVVKSPPPTEKEKTLGFSSLASKELELDSLLPEGFLNRTRDRGLVVKSWAPQAAILNRESVGGFVTHCGWSSVLEAICAGVPMLAWPLYAEQHINKAGLVEDMKLAMPMEQAENGFVSAIEVEKRVRALMESEDGKTLREQSRKMRENAQVALAKGGSSVEALRKLVESWNPN
ncbi:PREDICTED: UDP-glycosyltransferase 88F5-like [Nelumbo nucifera]|uniref:Glycosyltransferase n=2 Tax=Nelumbo nucifera TaxID=4432 RepID=A0A1U7Z0Q7_NELNU|nr:PREDICTED: UDP-glycosyltransferase 88F5-like [Nelumbo nucifera]DAD21067.1 TPA_asm: hypothetical protein HUJ06_022529 [Nelumbo nucifera]